MQKRIEWIREVNPDCRIKINTVVTALNKEEILADKIKKLNIDRWKILKMREYEDGTFSNVDITVTKDEYERFLLRNTITGQSYIKEETLEGSYIIVDSNGYLISNKEESSHSFVGNCLTENSSQLFARLYFDETLYCQRYLN